MMDRTQNALENELQRRTRRRASIPERPEAIADVSSLFDLGSSGGSNIARNKDSMIAEAFQSAHPRLRQGQDIQPS